MSGVLVPEGGPATEHRVVRLGPYLVHARMARGGMADLFLATRRGEHGRHEVVALKRIRREFSQDGAFLRMFWDEARITRLLGHPNVAQLLDYGGEDRSAFLVFEFVAGVNLKTVLDHGPLPPHLTLKIGAAVAEGLHAAHEQRDETGRPLHIVHRDVTPMNIMITFDGTVKLLDFGIALARGRAEKTQQGVIKGKWSYLSPEQVLGTTVDRRADIFTFGAVLYEMLAGTRAFAGAAPLTVMRDITFDAPPPLEDLVSGLPPELSAVVNRCLQKNPDDRFATAQEIADELGAIGGTWVLVTQKPDDRSLGQYVEELFSERAAATKAIVERVLEQSERVANTPPQGEIKAAPPPALTDESADFLLQAPADPSSDELGANQTQPDPPPAARQAFDTDEVDTVDVTAGPVGFAPRDTDEVETVDVLPPSAPTEAQPQPPETPGGLARERPGPIAPEVSWPPPPTRSPGRRPLTAFAVAQLPKLLAMLIGILLGCAVAVALWLLQ